MSEDIRGVSDVLEGEILTDDQIQEIIAPHMGHRVGIARPVAHIERVVAIDCLTCGPEGEEVRIWPSKN